MINIYLLILGIGHLLGDFYFQSEKVAKYKDEKYEGVLWHSLEYYIAVILTTLPVFSLDMIFAATNAALAHLAIDTIKYVLLIKKKIRKSGRVFVMDQCAHAISIFVLAYIMDCWNFSIGHIGTIERLIMLVLLSVNQYSAMGFVLTAKSIARYDKITKDEKFAEYYLLGTLVSTL